MLKKLVLLGLLFYLPLEARFYFIHIPKTAGTTLRLMLEKQVSDNEIYLYQPLIATKEPIHHELVLGHLSFELCRKLDPDFQDAFKITVLREPVDRYLSFLRMIKRNYHPHLDSVMNELSSQESSYDNAMCRFLADDSQLEGEELLQSAKKNLETMDCILFFDTFAKDTVALFKRLKIDIEESEIPKMNASIKEPISEELLEKINQENLLDIQLYEYAKTSLKKQHTGYQLRKQSFEAITVPKTSIDYTFNLALNGKGWSSRNKIKEGVIPWPSYRWIMNEPASIYLPLKEKRELTISFVAQVFADSIKMCVNGHEVALLKSGIPPFFQYEGIIEKNWLKEGLTEISFYFQNKQENRSLRDSCAIHSIHIY